MALPLSYTRNVKFLLHLYWGVQDLNLRRHCHQIYSLTPLTTRETPLYFRSRLPPATGRSETLWRPPTIRASETRQPSIVARGFLDELAEGLEPTTC